MIIILQMHYRNIVGKMVKDNKAFVNRQKRREGMLADSASIEIIWTVMSRSKQKKIDSLVNQNNIKHESIYHQFCYFGPFWMNIRLFWVMFGIFGIL